MILDKIVRRLLKERAKLDELIASLERLKMVTAKVEQKRAPLRRGRKFMAEDERRAVSSRMKKYWAERNKAR